MMRLDPLTLKKLKRFRSIKRGYWSAVALAAVIGLSFFAEAFVNSRALVVRYQGRWFFPTYGAVIPGRTFGLDYDYETNYRKLAETFAAAGGTDWVVLPPAPYNAYENDLPDGVYPPTKPSWKDRHYLGTDTSGRDRKSVV